MYGSMLYYTRKKIRDTHRWLCARGKHTATCDRVANFLSTGGTSTGADAKGPRTLILQQLLIVKSFTHLE